MSEERKITAGEVKALREKTGAGMMDCKRALEEASGDFDKAVRILREKGIASVKRRQEKSTEQGIIDSYIHIGGQIGAMVELKCETDFVAKNSEFIELAHQIAMHVAAFNPKYLSRNDVPEDVLESKKELFRDDCRARGKPENVWDQIIEGMLEKFFEEVCLLDQPFVKDPSMTVAELVAQVSSKVGEKIVVRRFCRYQVGEYSEEPESL